MTYFIMLPCYLVLIGAFAYSMRTVANPNGNILLGVKLPMEEMDRPEIQQMVKTYKKKNKYLTIGMFLTTFLGIFLRSFPMISTLYCLVMVGIWLFAMRILLVKTFDEVYTYKKEHILMTQSDVQESEKDDDIYWRGGTYKNPNDPKLWVEKRLGIGMTMNMAHTAGKVVDAAITAIMLGCVIMLICFIPLDFPSLSLKMDADQICVNATQYDTKIKFDDITKASVITSLPKLYKNNGFETSKYNFGQFRAKEYGQSKVYINKEQPKEYLVVYTKDNIYFLNSDKTEELNACIKELQSRDLLR